MRIGARTLVSPTIPPTALGGLLRALRSALGEAAGEAPALVMAAAVGARLERLPPAGGGVAPADVPVARHVTRALAGRDPLAQALARVLPHLAWRRTYAGAPGLDDFLEGYGYAELVGPGGPVPAADLRLGVLLLGPGTLYPLHRHPAEEIYLVVSGTASWRRGDGPFLPRPPGSLIHHPCGEPHAMRAADEPLLAVYAWTGEVAVPARLVADGSAD